MAIKENNTETETSGIKGICDTNSIMFELWERTSHTLTKEELEWFSGATQQAECLATSLQGTVSGIGSLVSDERNSGSFQSHYDLPGLLFSITNSIDTIRGLIQVGSSADDRLKNPDLYRKLNALEKNS